MKSAAFNIPNILTMLRFCMVPVVVIALVNQHWTIAFVVFVAAGVTDAVDGFIARHFDMRTELGAYLDPLADKSLLVSIYVTMSAGGLLPVWLTILVVSRDIMIVGGVMISWLLDKPLDIDPSRLSKINTLAQISFAAVMLFLLAFGLKQEDLAFAGSGIVAALTVGSMLDYLGRWLRHMAD